jgi:hypothetical protein
LTLEHLVAAGTFNAANWRHRRALDESVGPLADPELEGARQLVVDLRGSIPSKYLAAQRLEEFAQLVSAERTSRVT